MKSAMKISVGNAPESPCEGGALATVLPGLDIPEFYPLQTLSRDSHFTDGMKESPRICRASMGCSPFGKQLEPRVRSHRKVLPFDLCLSAFLGNRLKEGI